MRHLRLSLLGLGLLAAASPALSQARITSTKEAYGFTIGDDYRLANYTQFSAYLKTLAKESDRMRLEVIGRTAEGRDQLMAIITSPANQKLLSKYRGISQRLAHAEGLTDDQARALAAEGKAVVWIDGGLHATEVLGAAQLTETIYQLVSRNDPETLNILNQVIVLAVHANPDGMELVSNWYMKEPDEKERRSGDIPRLYQKYIGHDNNRDFYMVNQPESQNIVRQLFVEWFPVVVYNHHQTGPTGAVMFAPPFRDPFNYNFDPLVPVELDLVGAAMHSRFEAEGKPGVTMRKGANYSTWWNGGLRTSAYFHNQIGLLTETIGNPTPVQIEFVPQRMLPNADMPLPITPQTWHFRQSIDYSITANWAVLDLVARMKETFLFRMYKMGRNSIDRGNRDHWTFTPHDIAALQAKVAQDMRPPSGPPSTINPTMAPGGLFVASAGGRSPVAPVRYFEELKDPAKRDPRGYIIPRDQADFPTATKFINTLIQNGVTVHRATRDFALGGKSYPAGSFVVRCAQAFRPHILDMFEPQDHPNDFASPGGPPIPPYDNAGWTLAYQMGVRFDRLLEPFDGPFEALPARSLARPPAGQVAAGSAGYLLPSALNDSFLVVNRLLKAGAAVERMTSGGSAGAFYVTGSDAALRVLRSAATELGVSAAGLAAKPDGDSMPLRPVRVGLADVYGGSSPSGWIRWVLEQFEFASVDLVFPQDIDAGNLNAAYDVLIFPDEILPEKDDPSAPGRQPSEERAGEFKNRLGRFSVAKSVPRIKAFLEAGGKVLTIGSSTVLGRQLGLVGDHLAEKTAAGEKKLGREKYYVPGSILRAEVNPDQPLAWGLSRELDVFFDNSPVFDLPPDSPLKEVTAVAWFPNPTPLRSGWAWGQYYLEGGVAVAEAKVGQGRLMMFGPEIAFRGQPHGTFKFLFNGIYR